MKRRLPITIQGEFVLAASRLPPHTDEAKRQQPTASQPGRPIASRHAAATATTAHRRVSPRGTSGTPPSSTASPAKPVARRTALVSKRRTQPRAVV